MPKTLKFSFSAPVVDRDVVLEPEIAENHGLACRMRIPAKKCWQVPHSGPHTREILLGLVAPPVELLTTKLYWSEPKWGPQFPPSCTPIRPPVEPWEGPKEKHMAPPGGKTSRQISIKRRQSLAPNGPHVAPTTACGMPHRSRRIRGLNFSRFPPCR